jgi:uncharacterized protein YbjT (DUF2867 family)
MTMRIFVTGATGFIGSAVVRELLDAGHQVLGLARTDRAGETLAWLGAAVHKGELSDLESLAAGALACEGVIHLGFVHDSGDFPAAAETDREAIAAMGGALANSDKIFIGTSGTMLLAPGRLAAWPPGRLAASAPRTTQAIRNRPRRSASLRKRLFSRW